MYDPKLILFALTPQGKTLFLKQMKKFVERLENAEEEEEGEGVEEENAEEEEGEEGVEEENDSREVNQTQRFFS